MAKAAFRLHPRKSPSPSLCIGTDGIKSIRSAFRSFPRPLFAAEWSNSADFEDTTNLMKFTKIKTASRLAGNCRFANVLKGGAVRIPDSIGKENGKHGSTRL